MNSPQEKPAITLEDLLRLKRAEHPPEVFWGEFERDLRAKQLAAIIEPRPWWAPLIRVGAHFSRYQLPVGAAAILTVSFLTVREYRTADFAPGYGPEITVNASVPVETAKISEAPSAQPEPAVANITAMPVTLETAAAPVIPAQPAAIDPMPPQASASVTLIGEASSARREPTPSARNIAANLAAAQAAESGLGNTFSQPTRSVSLRQTMREPLAQVAPPSESRLARLLSPALPAIAGVSEASLRSTDRVARNLTEDRLYDSISRISARGAGVALKF